MTDERRPAAPCDDPPKTGARCRFAGEAAQVSRARRFVAGLLGDNCPSADEVTLLTSEIVTNAVQHSASGNGGGFEVAVSLDGRSVRVEVRDQGASSVPQVTDTGNGSDVLAGGRGLMIVDVLADRWGYEGGEHGRVVWFEIAGKPDD